MKIAFVGKGGSGKSTVAGLFIRHLINNKQKVVAIDADINQHLASIIGAEFDTSKSLDNHKTAIRQHLIGNNSRINSAKAMIKTTPPGNGSNLMTISDNDEIIQHYSEKFAENGYFMHVGTYKDDSIGMSCYHSSLSVLENILSHSDVNQQDEWTVVDMVAGTDAFSGPLHAMFDTIFMVVEPTVESVGVYDQFIHLAKSAGVESRVKIVANKIEDLEDITYIETSTSQQIVAYVDYSSGLRKQRREGGVLQLTNGQREAMKQISTIAKKNVLNPNVHLAKLHALHDVFARQKFTIDKYGDTLSHIDTGFSFDAKG